MNDAVIRALSFFDASDTSTPKLNCAQSVLAGLGAEIGIDRRTAVRVGRAFGGGIGHQGDLCGALCGAVIALGFATDSDSEPGNRSLAGARARELFRRFRERHGHVHCRLLIGVDPSTPEGEREVEARGIHRTHCPHFVQSAVEIAADLLMAETDRAGTVDVEKAAHP